MRIINLVDSLARVNFGIWNAAIATAPALHSQYGVESWVVYPKEDAADLKPLTGLHQLALTAEEMQQGVEYLVKKLALNPATDVVVSHGTWRYPTQWCAALKKKGFIWIYTPQGMLEPWSMSQKRLKKQVYFALKEKPMASKADLVRAVSLPEQKNLERIFSNVALIPNGVDPMDKPQPREKAILRFVFMARLHHKKGILPLVRAWQQHFSQRTDAELIIAGPDDGEEAGLKQLLTPGKSNCVYVGPLYGNEKHLLLQNAHFYVLPSYSEGFPSSVVEAMNYGCVPIISDGCNFPEAFKAGVAIHCSPEEKDITEAISKALALTSDQRIALSQASHQFIAQGYTTANIAEQQYRLFQQLLQKRAVAA